MRRPTLALTLLAACIALAAPVLANDRVPPRTTLHHGSGVQRGLLSTRSWARPSTDGLCVTKSVDSLPRFGRPLHVGAGPQPIRIRFHKVDRPKDGLLILAWTTLDSGGNPLGKAERLRYHLRGEMHHGRPQWIARLTPAIASDLYLLVFARWKDTDGCGTLQDASWTFHLAP
jgi:hypothetical protein